MTVHWQMTYVFHYATCFGPTCHQQVLYKNIKLLRGDNQVVLSILYLYEISPLHTCEELLC